MRLVGIKSLLPGDKLGERVCSTSGKVILNAGSVLTDSYIDKLKQIGIHKVYIEDDRFNDIEIMHPLDLETRNNAMKAVRTAYEGIQKSKAIDEYAVKDVAKHIVDYVRDYRDKGVSILSLNAIDDYIVEHSINVAILTAFIGNRMSYNFSQLCDLVTGAVIHDLGRENTREEKPDHVQKGFDVMRKCRGLSLLASIVCYEHHENFDGTGYPRKLKGTDISEFTRVVSLADVYDNALHGYSSNSHPMMPHQAFEYILAVSGKVLDPAIVEIFRDTIVFYPNGCTVLLSNKTKGVVVRQNLRSPQRPVVRIYDDREVIGEVDLLKNLTVFVEDVVVI